MNKTEVYDAIIKALDNANFSKVIKIWEEFGWGNLDFLNDADKEICDAVADSYTHLQDYSKALFYIESRIKFMKTNQGEYDRISGNYSNWWFYNTLKSSIYFEEKKYIELYKSALEYKRFGGKEEGLLTRMQYIESIYYLKHLKRPIYKFAYLLSIVTPGMVILRILSNNIITTSAIYYILFVLFSFILILYTYFYKMLENVSGKVFMKILTVVQSA